MRRTEYKDKNWIFPFVEYAPEDAGENLPLIIQLHGAGESGRSEDDLYMVDIHGFSNLIKKGGEYPCRFIMPQCPYGCFWAGRVESIIAFIDQLKQNFSVNEDKVYLTGMSMGGYGTWYTAMARPDLFAAIAPVCGGGMAWNAAVLKMPVWAFHSADDPTVSVVQSDEMIEGLRPFNSDVTYTRYEDKGHASWVPAYSEELLNWLLSKSR